jgi:LysM repeat protein
MRPTLRIFLTILVLALMSGTAWAVFAQDNSTSYTVESGDSLDKIGALFDVQAACLAQSNDLTLGSMIKPGDVLVISFDCPRYDGFDFVTNPREEGQAPAEPAAGQGGGSSIEGDTYTVQRGDTLDTIGQELNVSVVAIQLANGLRSGDFITPGQELVIPEDAPAYGLFPALTEPANPNSVSNELGQGGGGAESLAAGDTTYVVQPRDSFDKIGALFDVQAACLAQSNELRPDSAIYPGQVLNVSEDCPRYDGEDFVVNPREG